MSEAYPIQVQVAGIPDELKLIKQWVCWREEPDPERPKPKKVPIAPLNLQKASSTNRASWGTFAQAQFHLDNPTIAGIGFVLSGEDPYSCIDLDKCRDPATGILEDWAEAIVDQVRSYTEVSCSGTGVHIFVRGMPVGVRRRVGQVEIYSQKRFIAMTGEVYKGLGDIEDRQAELQAVYEQHLGRNSVVGATASSASIKTVTDEDWLPPSELQADDAEALSRACLSAKGDRIKRLHAGDTSGYDSHSEADLGFLSLIAFWCGPDPACLDRIFRSSKLFRPEKWDRIASGDKTYGQATIEKALSGKTQFYGWKRSPCAQSIEQRPLITLDEEDVAAIYRAAEEALLCSSQEPIYQRDGAMVRLVRQEAGGALRLTPWHSPYSIHRINSDYLGRRLSEAAIFIKPSKSANKPVRCPAWLSEGLLASAGRWPFPTLRGLLCAPTLLPSGELLATPGFDPKSGLFLDTEDLAIAELPSKPSQEEATKALQKLLEPISKFPFVDEASRYAAVAAVLTALVRPLLPSAPLFAFRSPKMGSGKSLLADIVSIIATGRPVAASPVSRSTEEQKKMFLSLLLRGEQIICLDNVDVSLGSNVLSMMLTQETYADRILGVSEAPQVGTTTTWLATGNNLQFEGDLTTRVLPVDIDAKVANPEERKFKGDLRVEVFQRRADLIWAALVVIRAYQAAGTPEIDLPVYGRFEDWSRVVRKAIVWAKGTDPCAGRKRLEAEDPVRLQLIAILAAWYEKFGDSTITTAEALGYFEDPDLSLNASLVRTATGVQGKSTNPVAFGRYLSQNTGRPEGGYRLNSRGVSHNAKLWSVTREVTR